MSDIFIGDIIEVLDAGKQYGGYAPMAHFMGLSRFKCDRDIRKQIGKPLLVIGKSYHHVKGSQYAPILAVEAADTRQYLIGEDGVHKVGHILDNEEKEAVTPRFITGHSHTK